MTLQITIIKIEGYGPWTLELGSDRESQLQMLQARIYYDLQRLFSDIGGLVFSNRFDEYFAISNGISIEQHKSIQKEIANSYTLKLSMAIGINTTAFRANIDAYKSRQEKMPLDRETAIFGKPLQIEESYDNNIFHGKATTPNNPDHFISNDTSNKISSSSNNNNIYNENTGFVQIMHIDVDNSTNISLKLSPYEITSFIIKLYSRLSEKFLRKEAITFFLGGDNFMVVSNELTKKDAEEIITDIEKDLDIRLNCGIGKGRTARKAAEAATKALDTIRSLRKEGKIQPIYEIQCT